MPFRKILWFFLFCFLQHTVSAQYADRGTGKLKPYIWWFDWNGFTVADGASKTFNTHDGIVVTIRFSNVSGAGLRPDIMNTWNGAVLHNLYDFTNSAIQPALHSVATNVTARFDMEVTATRNGVAIPFTLIAADAEGSVSTEVTHFTTSGGPWQAVEYFTNISMPVGPLFGCNTQTIEISNTYGGSSGMGQNPMMATYSNGTAPLRVNSTLQRASSATGGMAVTFGILSPIDRGDLPVSYPTAQHAIAYSAINGCNLTLPGPSLVPTSDLHFGSIIADADAVEGIDDNTDGVDEDGISVFPDYNGSTGNYTVNLTLVNQTSATAYASGWMDWNMDGTFTAAERVVVPVPAGTNLASFSWTGLPYSLADGGTIRCGFRFRIAGTSTAVEQAGGFAADGEVEDYYPQIVQTCNVTKVNAGTDMAICMGRVAQLQATGALTYRWEPNPRLSALTIPNPTANITTNTSFFVYAEHANGCNSRDTVAVRVDALPVLNVTPGNFTVCQGTPITFTATGADNVSWSDYTGAAVGTGNTLTVTPQLSAPYTAVLRENLCGQTATITLPVMVTPRPVVDVTPRNAVICEGRQVTFNASGGGTYTWADGQQHVVGTASQLVMQPAASGNYTVRIVNTVCAVSESFNLSVTVRKPGSMSVTPASAYGCKDSRISFTASGMDEAIWETEDGTVIGPGERLVTDITSSTAYHVTLRDNVCGTEQRVTLPVTMRPPPVLSIIKSNDINCMEGSATLSVSGAAAYNWLPAPGITDRANPVQQVSPTATTKYHVAATDYYGCTNNDSITVAVSYTGPRPHFQLPNAFTPNRDGINDCFGVKTAGPATRFELSVFDRWGNVVFRTNKANDCWDGTYRNVPLDIGTFVYVLRIESECGPVERKGTVTLIR